MGSRARSKRSTPCGERGVVRMSCTSPGRGEHGHDLDDWLRAESSAVARRTNSGRSRRRRETTDRICRQADLWINVAHETYPDALSHQGPVYGSEHKAMLNDKSCLSGFGCDLITVLNGARSPQLGRAVVAGLPRSAAQVGTEAGGAKVRQLHSARTVARVALSRPCGFGR